MQRYAEQVSNRYYRSFQAAMKFIPRPRRGGPYQAFNLQRCIVVIESYNATTIRLFACAIENRKRPTSPKTSRIIRSLGVDDSSMS